jgi:hypothetical protein
MVAAKMRKSAQVLIPRAVEQELMREPWPATRENSSEDRMIGSALFGLQENRYL